MKSPLIRLLQNPFRFYKESILPKARRKFPVLKYGRSLTPNELLLSEHLSRYKTNWDANKKGVVLMQIVEDHAFTLKLSATAHHLAKKHNANIGLYHVESKIERPDYPDSFLYNTFFTEALDKIYLSVGGKVLFKNSDDFKDAAQVQNTFKAIKSQLSSKYDVLNICIEDIKIGDLLYDTYLRFANKTTVDIKDPYFDKLLLQAVHIYYNSKKTLDNHNIVALVNSYTTYTKHGIMARLCLNRNIPVYVPLCGFISIVHKVLKSFPTHRNNHFTYSKLFAALDNKQEILTKYKSIFEKRFEGFIDGATFYMKQSAFSGNDNPELNDVDWPNTVVILAHCFFDSPHIYRDLLFPDFYEWMTFTLDQLQLQKNVTVLVKQHPNGLPYNDEIFAQLKVKYANSNIRFIDKKTSQLQILKSRPKAIITAYGTAAAEFAYHDYPVLTIYDNPFTSFDFTHVANSVEEYKTYLANIMQLTSKCNRDAIIEYYYMHNYFFLNGRDADYLGFNKYQGNTYNEEFLQDFLPKLNNNYFATLDQSVADGMKLIDWEYSVCKEDYQ